MTTFADFLQRYNDGTLVDDAAWRAYDIEGMAKVRHAQAALPLIGYNPSLKRHPYSGVASKYGLSSTARAEYLLGIWYVWRGISNGSIRRGVLRETDG